ncbi:MAG: hypothetical protein ACWA5U_03100 [bacterium]
MPKPIKNLGNGRSVMGVCLCFACLVGQASAEQAWLPDQVGLKLQYSSDLGQGYGGELAWAIAKRWQARFAVYHYDEQQAHTINLIDFTEDRSRTDLALFVDRQLFANQGFYATLGAINVGDGSRWQAHANPRFAYTLNGRQYAGVHLQEPQGRIQYNDLAPYLGFGWRSTRKTHTSQTKANWQLGAEVGLLSNLNPRFKIHTDNPYQLPLLEQDLQAEADRYLNRIAAEKGLLEDQEIHFSLSAHYSF